MLIITSKHIYSEDSFERKLQAKLFPYNQSFEKQEEELIYFKGKQEMEPNMFSSEHITNEVINPTSEHQSS